MASLLFFGPVQIVAINLQSDSEVASDRARIEFYMVTRDAFAVESQLISAILANPQDESGHLIYADWLEEQGDVRAEFIRGYFQVRSIPVWHSDYLELKRHVRELRDGIDESWINRLSYGDSYRPMLDAIPESYRQTWSVVKELTSYWQPGNAVQQSQRGGTSQEVELRLGVALPRAFREWLDSDISVLRNRFINLEALEYDPLNKRIHCGQQFQLTLDGTDDPIVRGLRAFRQEEFTVSRPFSHFMLGELLTDLSRACANAAKWELRAGGFPSKPTITVPPIFRRSWVEGGTPERRFQIYEGIDVLMVEWHHRSQEIRCLVRSQDAERSLMRSIPNSRWHCWGKGPWDGD